MVDKSNGGGDAGRRSIGQYELLAKLYDVEPGTLWVCRDSKGEDASKLLTLHQISFGGDVTEEVGDRLVEAWEWTPEIAHERVLTAREVLGDEAGLAVVADYVEGEPRGSLLRLGSVRRVVFPAPVAVHIALDVLDGLGHVHGRADELSVPGRYVFGGVGPSTVLVGTDGRARLVEPGVAAAASGQKAWADDPKRAAYAAPEMVLRGKDAPELDARTDVFAVGILLWELVQNRRLFSGLSHAAVAKKVQSQTIERVDAQKPAGGEAISKAVADVVAKALERDPTARYATVKDFASALRATADAHAGPADVSRIIDQLAGKALAARRVSIERAVKGIRASLAPPAIAAATDAAKKPVAPVPDRKGLPAPTGDRRIPPPPKLPGPDVAKPSDKEADPGRRRPPLPPRAPGAPPPASPALPASPAPPKVKPVGGPPRRASAADKADKDKPTEVGTEWDGPISEERAPEGTAEAKGEGAEPEDETELATQVFTEEDGVSAFASSALLEKLRAGKAAAKAAAKPAAAKASDQGGDAGTAEETSEETEEETHEDAEAGGAEGSEPAVDEESTAAEGEPPSHETDTLENDVDVSEAEGEAAPAAERPAPAVASPKPAAVAAIAPEPLVVPDEGLARSKRKRTLAAIVVGVAALAVVLVVWGMSTGSSGAAPSASAAASAAPATTLAATVVTSAPVPSATETAAPTATGEPGTSAEAPPAEPPTAAPAGTPRGPSHGVTPPTKPTVTPPTKPTATTPTKPKGKTKGGKKPYVPDDL